MTSRSWSAARMSRVSAVNPQDAKRPSPLRRRPNDQEAGRPIRGIGDSERAGSTGWWLWPAACRYPVVGWYGARSDTASGGRCCPLVLGSDGGGRHRNAGPAEDSAQDVGGGRLLDVDVQDVVRFYGADGDVDVIGGPATADRRVQLLPGHQLVDEAVGGVRGDPLGGVDGGGVAELDRLPHIRAGQGDGLAGAAVDGADPAVRGEAGDGPAVTVADPPGAAGHPAVVAAGDDQVAGTGLVPVCELNLSVRGVADEPVDSGA